MANRFPLIIDANDNKIKEIPENDNLSLHNNSIIGVVNITSEGTITAESLYINSATVNINGNFLSDVAFTGKYIDLVERPLLFTGSYNDLTDKPTLFTGSYNDLTDKPTNLSQFTNDVGFLTLAESPTLSLIGTTLRITNGNSVDLSELGSGGNSGIALTNLSVTSLAAAGSGTLTYDDTTGVFTYTPPNLSAYLTDYTETDPVVGAVNGIVKADGAGNISAAVAGTDYLSSTSDIDTHLNQNNPTSGYVLSWDGTDYAWVAQTAGGGSYSDTDVATYLNGNLNTHIIPDTNATYDIGAAEFKIRHLYLSDNSLKFVNASNTEYSMGVDVDGELTFQNVKLSDAAVAKVTSADLDMGGNRVLFANVYTNLADLPDASAYHGMFAHVHSEAAAYYAHAGSWVKLANDGAGGGGATTLDALTDVTAAGSADGEVLTSDGAGNFAFEPVVAQLGRNQYAGTTASLGNQASGDLDVTGCKTYTLFKISTDVAAWVIMYTDAASRTADTRTYADKGSDPSTGGVVAEVITTGAETIIIAPGVIGFNNEATPTSNMPMRVFNDSGGAATVTVTVDVLTLEV